MFNKITLLIIVVIGFGLIATKSNAEDNSESMITYEQIQPIIAENCGACHNASTPDKNWLNKDLTEFRKAVIYDRVFVKGDMPFWFKYFGGKDKELLRKYLEQPVFILDSNALKRGLDKARELSKDK